MNNEPVPLPEKRAIKAEFPGAADAEIARLWNLAPVVVAEWVRYNCEYSLNTSHPNMQAARLFYVLYSLTPIRSSRKREAHRLAAIQIMLPRWNFAAYCRGA